MWNYNIRRSLATRIKKKTNLFKIQWKLDLADTSLAENLGLKDTLQKIWAAVFDF